MVIKIPPPSLETDKRYFRIAKNSTFLCKTLWFEERRKGSKYHIKETTQFHCTMQIDSDIERALYKKDDSTLMFSHPEFGVDEIKDTNMKIDILVDEKNCKANLVKENKMVHDNFRELKK